MYLNKNINRLLIFFLTFLVFSTQQSVAHDQRTFHPPHTEAERTLDALLNSDYWYMLAVNGYDKKLEKRYAHLFSKKLLNLWRKREKELVQENCGGQYIQGDQCGFDYSPLTCAQDAPNAYFYRTLSQNNSMVIIQSAWSFNDPDETFTPYATYQLIKQGKRWILDDVACRDHGKIVARFN